ncbi:hypothetical protein [Polyangium fumosum]|uniref:Uncharacterized protein n=1 Tax=Polyangium fumosum TaxID=889272 RepID=A0A4U1I688_9BACT|nr:hypothetical protein [Polyangium fumosum]TKC88862.1 hypothetical protein E8A74_51470 [Polyangium fumosum]
MTGQILVTLAPERERVRMLVTSEGKDMLKAVLGPLRSAHPRAAATLLEGLALWHEQPLSVVLCADDSVDSCALDLYETLGFGRRALHYEVGIAYRRRRGAHRDPRLSQFGDFRDLRKIGLGEVLR